MLTVLSVFHRRKPLGLTLVLTLAVAVLPLEPLRAVEVESLYTVQVPLESRDADARQAAYRDALRQILVRITGSQEAGLSPELNELFPDPARFVLQFRPGEEDTLQVSMDGEAIASAVRQTGYPVWGSDRPATVLWLAVDWGQGDRELISAGTPDAGQGDTHPMNREDLLRQRVEDVARQRGVPLIIPRADSDDLQTIRFTDVWGGFHDQLLEASRRYGANSILVGRLRPGVAQRNRWSFYFRDRQQQWTGEPEEAIHQLADTLAGQLAVSRNSPLQAVSVTISGVDSVAAYGEVDQLIAGLAAVERYTVQSVAGDRIRYRIVSNAGISSLESALEFSNKLTRTEAVSLPLPGGNPPDTAGLQYDYNP